MLNPCLIHTKPVICIFFNCKACYYPIMCHRVYKIMIICIYLTGHLLHFVTKHTPPIMFSSSRNASSTCQLGQKPTYSCKNSGCHGIHIANPIANVIITDHLIVEQKVIYNQCRTQWIVCTICESRFGFTNLQIQKIIFKMYTPVFYVQKHYNILMKTHLKARLLTMDTVKV